MHIKEVFRKLLPVSSGQLHFFSERVPSLSSTSREAPSRHSLTLDTQTEEPGVAVQIKEKKVLGLTLTIYAKKHQKQEKCKLPSTETHLKLYCI